MEGKRAGEEAEAAGRPEMQEAAGGGGEALCLSCSLGPSVHSVHPFLGSTDWINTIRPDCWMDPHCQLPGN